MSNLETPTSNQTFYIFTQILKKHDNYINLNNVIATFSEQCDQKNLQKE